MAVKNFVTLYGTRYDLADGVNLSSSVETTATAAYKHDKGSVFLYNGELYGATANIAVGGTITPDTNCERLYIGDEVDDVKNHIVMVQDTQPSDDANRIWLPETVGDGVEVPTMDEFNDLKSAITERVAVPKSRVYVEGTYNSGKWQQSNGSEYSAAYACYLSAAVEAGKQYYVTGVIVNSSFPLIVMFNEGGSVIGTKETSPDSTKKENVSFVPPEGCVRVSINSRRNLFTYPCIYSYTDGSMNGDDIQDGLQAKQTKTLVWKKAEYTLVSNQYANISNYIIVPTSQSATSYSYTKILYDKTKKYRFYGVCRVDTIPFVACCDADDNIIALFNTVGAYKAQAYDIPENTYAIYVNGYSSLVARVEIAEERKVQSLEAMKTGVFFGDSLTQGLNTFLYSNATPFEDYPSIVSNVLGCTVYNGGLGGGTYSSGRSIDLKNIVDCVVSGNYSSVYDGIDEYSLNAEAKTQYDAISQLDFSKVDFVVFSFGTNDWNFGTVLSTVESSMRYCIETLLTAYPNLKLYILTPIMRFNVNNSGQDSDIYVNAQTGKKLPEICEMIADIAKEYKLPCKDMYHESNINAFTKSIYFDDSDGTHPIAAGYAVMAEKIAKFINAN